MLSHEQYDLDDNGRLDSNEFVKMLQVLGRDVTEDEAAAAMEVWGDGGDTMLWEQHMHIVLL